MLVSQARKNQLTSWRRRLIQHAVSLDLILRRIKAPRQSLRLFMAPFVDKKLSVTNQAEESKTLANSLRTIVLLNSDSFNPVNLEDFDYHFGTKSVEVQKNKVLGHLFDKFGSDKWSNSYDVFYEKILDELLQEKYPKVQVFEIGLGTNNLDVLSNMGLHGKPGASLRAFREYSERIQTIGADIDKRILFQEDRIQTYFVDQLNFQSLVELHEIANESHLIIDDGLHNPEANLNTLLAYKNSMKIGSWIVIEDISKTEFNLKLWKMVRALIPEFKSEIFNLPNSYVFIGQKIRSNESV
jgi:hypothetical protein